MLKWLHDCCIADGFRSSLLYWNRRWCLVEILQRNAAQKDEASGDHDVLQLMDKILLHLGSLKLLLIISVAWFCPTEWCLSDRIYIYIFLEWCHGTTSLCSERQIWFSHPQEMARAFQVSRFRCLSAIRYLRRSTIFWGSLLRCNLLSK